MAALTRYERHLPQNGFVLFFMENDTFSGANLFPGNGYEVPLSEYPLSSKPLPVKQLD